MRTDDLDLRELLDFSPRGGVMRFAGERVLLWDAGSMGELRRDLISALGLTAARGLLTRFGFAHGVRTAERMKTALKWDSERDWRVAGGRLHTLQGLVRVEPIADADGAEPFAHVLWHDSYEAEQHILRLGQADEPVCWTLAGFASGYLSHVNGRSILCVEDRCRGKGDAVCRMVGRPEEEWDRETVEKLRPFFEREGVEDALARVTAELRRTERKLRLRRRDLDGDEDAVDPHSNLVARAPAMRFSPSTWARSPRRSSRARSSAT